MFEKLVISLLVKLKDSKLYIKIGTHFAASKDSMTFSSVFVPILLKIELSAQKNLVRMGWKSHLNVLPNSNTCPIYLRDGLQVNGRL